MTPLLVRAATGFFASVTLSAVLCFAVAWILGPKEVGYGLGEAFAARFPYLLLLFLIAALPAFMVMRVVLLLARARSDAAFAGVSAAFAMIWGGLWAIPSRMIWDAEMQPLEQGNLSVADIVSRNQHWSARIGSEISLFDLVFWAVVGALMRIVIRRSERFDWLSLGRSPE